LHNANWKKHAKTLRRMHPWNLIVVSYTIPNGPSWTLAATISLRTDSSRVSSPNLN
jgi:hypothetical protein